MRLAHTPGIDGPPALALRLAIVTTLRDTFGAHVEHRRALEQLLAAAGCADVGVQLFALQPVVFVRQYFGATASASVERERVTRHLQQLLSPADDADALRLGKTRKQLEKLLAARHAKLAKQRAAVNDAIRALEARRKLRQALSDERAMRSCTTRSDAQRDGLTTAAALLASL